MSLPQSGPADRPGVLGFVEIQVVRRHRVQRAVPADAQDARMIGLEVVDEGFVNRQYDLARLALLQQQSAYFVDSKKSMRRSCPSL